MPQLIMEILNWFRKIWAIILCGKYAPTTELLNEPLGPDGLALPIEKKRFYSWFENPKSFTNWTGLPGLFSLLKWRITETDKSAVPSPAELDETIPVEKLEKFEADSPFYASWLGHATVIIHIEGVNFITDPIWAERASPLGLIGPQRYRPPPMKIEDLPQMDFGVVSHDHYDHLDENAVKKISQRNPNMKWFVPLKMKEWMIDVGMNGENITEMNWGDKSKFEKDGKEFEVLCLPAQHWGMRNVGDRNKRLWSGWSVSSPTRKFFYSGDTGFCDSEYKKIGEKFGPFDLAAIPIGAYEPRWIMKSQHIDPDEAVKVHKLIRSKYSIGIHWGTYLMGSFEPYLAPKERLEELMEAELKMGTAPFEIINMGRIWKEKVSVSSL